MTNDELPHRRFNPLTGRWLQVSPHRSKRPWQGATEESSISQPEYDPDCYLCPNNTRANGKSNPDYASVYVFDNDFPALLGKDKINEAPKSTSTDSQADLLLQKKMVSGQCRVICYSPRHDQHFGSLSIQQITQVIKVWAEQTTELSETYQHVQIFENRGSAMGCSNPHPHGQIWAIDTLPYEIERELEQQTTYYQEHNRALLEDYVTLEEDRQERVICENSDWLVCIPYWAEWPFETLLLPKFSVQKLNQLEPGQQQQLAAILKQLCKGYDALFSTPFPYSMGWHQAPSNQNQPIKGWQLHAHFYPPLLRSASVKKFMVGYEMLCESQRDITPEIAAALLREKTG